MKTRLKVYNTLGKKLENFEPLNPPFVGLYLCGPTVYGPPHLGHARGPIVIDVVFRYLTYLGFKVRYVRNITDVGHLVNDADEGEDKIQKRAKTEQLEPMEVAKAYADDYHDKLDLLNTLRPSIEPYASGHIIEQIEMIRQILEKGYAYVSEGSVYFDVPKYNADFDYGILSGRVLEELLAGSSSRELEGQDEKRNPADFALWKRASPEHIMRWPSPWSEGFPGWHIECSAMSKKYLGETFDIHAGGMDLLFPHHESEIAQSTACGGKSPAKYWLHNNMITINGQKMAKSLNNGILLEELFAGKHPLLEQAYRPMTLRFFILQAHYRGTLDFSNEALKAAEKGLNRLMIALSDAEKIRASESSDFGVPEFKKEFESALNDDFNTPNAIAVLFEGVKKINLLLSGDLKLVQTDLDDFKSAMNRFVFEILGLKNEKESGLTETVSGLMEMVIAIRKEAREKKDWGTSDLIRNKLNELGIELKDGKEGTTFSI